MPEREEKPSPARILAAAVRAGYCTEEQAAECRKAYEVVRELGLGETFESVVKKKGILTEEQLRDIERKLSRVPVIGNYELMERIGQGGMGTVFRARQISMDRVVALKVLTPRLASNKAFVERFMREARASAKLNHPNVIQGIDVGEAGGYYYFAMEYVDGPTIRKVLQDEGHFPPARALDIVIQIASALDHARANGLVHRDIKPDNIMLTKTGIAKLCDLGLARMTSEDSGLTLAGQAVGTPHYIAPEQARGVQDIDIRADIYSLGATFYHMTVGKTLFVGNSSADIMSKHIVEEAT
ncbi:MAG: serine/threonine protein kinase, partial [Planctomycetota bacterium]|nr:serine/threonine protein kinase [Planctomycetota bacterium]